ncbi:hypothetical protein [Rhodoplanes sp. Z2-YC6860]|uniref:hypothetical protein n=1 Tax=Rhodoplanes sp. Z2-YC6860 TaxID=674703 RepID=UPI0012ED58F8|nr:hypothetical protein [Rhodoplanes sp. Z2-YC6860]
MLGAAAPVQNWIPDHCAVVQLPKMTAEQDADVGGTGRQTRNAVEWRQSKAAAAKETHPCSIT